MIVIGLTGSIGMGKSTTAQMFRELGIPVHDADASVHELYEGDAVPLIEATFPGSTRDGRVDRRKLGALVVGKPEAMKRLEAIIHPLVGKVRDAFMAGAIANGSDMVVLDIPLLFETGGDTKCDLTIVVTTNPDEQRRRVLARPEMTAEKFEKILASQMPDSEKRKRADFIIDTTNGLEDARHQVENVVREIRSQSNREGGRDA